MTLWHRVFEERRPVILALAIALVANLAALLLAVLPLRSSVETATVEAAEAHAALLQARRLQTQVDGAQSSKTRAEQELGRFYADVLPPDQPTATKTATVWLNQAAQDAGVVLTDTRFVVSPVRDSRLSRAQAQVTLQGRYPNIRRFLYAVETAKEFIIVESVELAQSSDTRQANDLLQVSLVVSTYFRTPPTS
ncbi:MAG TPA: GspMb/PilO family protein [Vicinamibacterales bacterium]|nr:GspMb/PilO family protein [Vicinamibacterales bacterium]